MPNDPLADELTQLEGQDDEIDRLISDWGGKAALMKQIKKRKERRGPKPQEDLGYLLQMARLVAEARLKNEDFELGRIAGIVADDHGWKTKHEREARIKTWKRKFRNSRLLRIITDRIVASGGALHAEPLFVTAKYLGSEKKTTFIRLTRADGSG